MDFLYSIFGFILAISILVFVHELGHFLAARACRVKVLKFSIGFGPAYCLGRDKFGTEYLISLIPLGGYIQLLDQAETMQNTVAKLNSPYIHHTAITEKSPWVRILILLAGPGFNLIFAWIVYVWVFTLGTTSNLPVIGKVMPHSIAAAAGLQPSMQIKKLGTELVNDWHEFANALLLHLGKDKDILVEAYTPSTAATTTHALTLAQYNTYASQGDLLKNLGIVPLVLLDPKISRVMPDYPAARAGLQAGDIIISIDNIMMTDPAESVAYISTKAASELKVQALRNNKILYFTVVPVLKSEQEPNLGAMIGVKYQNLPYPKELTVTHKYSILRAIQPAISKTYQQIKIAGYFVRSMVTGKLSWNNAAGPVAIGYYAGKSVQQGFGHFLNFLGMISVNLGILNLLPIPWLDGGSIVYCLYEIVRSKSLDPTLIQIARNVSLLLLLLLAVAVFINDIARL